MPGAGATALTRHYESLQSAWKVSDRSDDYGKLVVPHGNSSEPVHRWFHLKEAFSHQLLARLIKDAEFDTMDKLSVLDPFAGSGTSLLSALTFGIDSGVEIRALGIERNPFLHLLAKAKAVASMRGSGLVGAISRDFNAIHRLYRRLRRVAIELPPSVTLRNDKYFPRNHANDLIRIRTAIDSISRGAIRDVLHVCLGASVEASSFLRRDGRALRYEQSRNAQDPWSVFSANFDMALQDLRDVGRSRADVNVRRGDGRRPMLFAKGSERFDLIVFSPPYPNNIDYTEVYKLESWVLGHYKDVNDMRRQRTLTVRSHPSIKFKDSYSYEKSSVADAILSIVDPIVEAVPEERRYRTGRQQIVKGYADDMLQVFQGCRQLASENTRLIFVVGNSVHGANSNPFIIAADIIMAAVAELAGWRVEEVRVARNLTRRGADSPLLRESVVSLRPV